MNALLEYRRKMVERLAAAAQEFCSACEAGKPSARVEEDWNLHQIAAHVRDVDRTVYSVRVQRTLQEENPLFAGFDPDAWMATQYNKEELLQKILNEFKANTDALCKTLNGIPQEAWSRESRHETIGESLTLQLWVERSLSHIEEHLEVIKKLI
jgi:hypothetical protein